MAILSTKIRVVLADGHYLRREGMRRLLAESGEAEVVAVTAEPDALLDAVGALRPDAVITSIVAVQLRRTYPRVGIVVFDEQVTDIAEVLRTLRAVMAGWVDPRLVDALVQPITTLTSRELDVVRHMASGHTNRAIAEALTLAESTVEKHVNTTFAKLGLGEDPKLHRRVAAVLTYLRATTGAQPPLVPRAG